MFSVFCCRIVVRVKEFVAEKQNKQLTNDRQRDRVKEEKQVERKVTSLKKGRL